MSSNPFYASDNNRFPTNESGYSAIPVRSSLEVNDRPEGNESNPLLKDDDDSLDGTKEELDRPWKYRIFALACALTLSVGSHYTAHTLGALKSTIKENLGISNSQYGILQSSVSLVNTILPILGGVFIDTFGTLTGSILATSLIAIGNILVALSTNLASFSVMVIGRIIYGLGSGTIVTIQTAILSHWFKGKGLSIVVGLQIATSRMSSFLGNLTVVPIKDATGFYGWSFWFAAFLCVVSFVINIFYILVMKVINENLSEQEILKLKQKKTFNPRKLLYLPTIYWIIVLLEFLFGGAWTSFLHMHAELLKTRWGYSDEEAGTRSSVAQFLPIFISPFLGYLLDKFGGRSTAVISSAAFLIASMYLLGFTLYTPIVGMLLFSVSMSFGPVPLLSSIPIILSLDYIGTGLGIAKSCSNVGSTLFDITIGILQDLDNDEYRLVMRLHLVNSVISLFVAILFAMAARKWYDGIVDMKETKRREYYEKIRVKRDEGEQERERLSYVSQEAHVEVRRPSKRNWVFTSTFVIVLILSWVLFFIFVI